MLTDDQKAIRRTGIGASECAAAVGLSPHTSPLVLYRRKVGELPEPEESWAMFLGNVLEPAILAMYVRETGAKLEHPGTLKHPGDPWMLCTPDALATLPDGRRVVVEAKRADYKRPDWGPAGTDEVPVTYACQCLWLMMVLRAMGERVEEAHVAAFFRGSDFQTFVVPWDESRATWLRERARAFWHGNVLARVPPEDASGRAA